MNCHEIAAEVQRVWESLPHKTGRDILGFLVQPMDEDKDFINRDDCYAYYYAVGRVLKPRRYVEIGVRFGYTMKAVVDGAGMWGEAEVYGIDMEYDGIPSNQVARNYLGRRLKTFELYRTDSRSLQKLEIEPVDLGHVDGYHTEEVVGHDSQLIWDCLKPGGVLMIDDCGPGEVKTGAERFFGDRGIEYSYLPTLRGMMLAVKN